MGAKPQQYIAPTLLVLWPEGGLNMYTLSLTLLDLGFSETLQEGCLLSS